MLSSIYQSFYNPEINGDSNEPSSSTSNNNDNNMDSLNNEHSISIYSNDEADTERGLNRTDIAINDNKNQIGIEPTTLTTPSIHENPLKTKQKKLSNNKQSMYTKKYSKFHVVIYILQL